MREMEMQLAELLASQGMITKGRVAYPRLSDLRHSDLAPAVSNVYRALGGKLDEAPLNLRAWDIEFEGMAVELDECLHFNRYRLITLMSPAYSSLPRFPLAVYQQYCRDYESQCLRDGSWGGRWSNSSCDAQFGKAGPKKQLIGSGASRWKQRAYYDFVKDLSPNIVESTVTRLAVWDEIEDEGGNRSVAVALASPRTSTGSVLAELLWSRVAQRPFHPIASGG